MLKITLSTFLLLLFVSAGFGQSSHPTGELFRMNHGGVERSYRLHIPAAVTEVEEKHPLVICLHGGGSNAATMSKAGWSDLADEEPFLIVYPDGLNGHWNDGREVRKHAAQNAVTDDVDFIIRMLEHLISEYPVDSTRVYVVGISNGGFMTQRLAVEHTKRFAAVAVQIASLPDTYLVGPLKFAPSAPLSVLFMNGTKDTFMPYEGGKLTPNLVPRLIDSETFDFGQGSAIATVDAVNLWVEHNKLAPEKGTVKELPDTAPEDGCRVIHHRWNNVEKGIAVELYKIEGGGHTIPGGTQYLPERIIGPLCRDINGIEATWEFFKDKSR